MITTKTEIRQVSLEDLWNSAVPSSRRFNPELLTDLPPLARRYLKAAILSGTPLASAVRLWMHGEIKLGQNWHSFQGEEVICWNRGMIWRATTWMQCLPIVGADCIVDGMGAMQWKMLGLFPVMQAAGEDVTRSGIGRMQGEAVWLPAVLCSPEISWIDLDTSTTEARFTALGEPAKLTLKLGDQDRLEHVQFKRWGNPEGEAYHHEDFGVSAQASATFAGYTIPTQIQAGWYFGSSRFESEGEFFRCNIDKAMYR